MPEKLNVSFIGEAEWVDFEQRELRIVGGTEYKKFGDHGLIKDYFQSATITHSAIQDSKYQMGKKYRVTIEEIDEQ